jgi:hypothetical protein
MIVNKDQFVGASVVAPLMELKPFKKMFSRNDSSGSFVIINAKFMSRGHTFFTAPSTQLENGSGSSWLSHHNHFLRWLFGRA